MFLVNYVIMNAIIQKYQKTTHDGHGFLNNGFLFTVSERNHVHVLFFFYRISPLTKSKTEFILQQIVVKSDQS